MNWHQPQISNRRFITAFTLLLPQPHSPHLAPFSQPAPKVQSPDQQHQHCQKCRFSGPTPNPPSRPTESEPTGWGRGQKSGFELALQVTLARPQFESCLTGKGLNPTTCPSHPLPSGPHPSRPLTWRPSCPLSAAASSLTNLSGSGSKPISYKKRSLIDNDYASCLYSIFIFRRPFTCVVSFHLLNNPARKRGEYDSPLTQEEMQPKGVRNCPRTKPRGGRARPGQANVPRPVASGVVPGTTASASPANLFEMQTRAPLQGSQIRNSGEETQHLGLSKRSG